MNELEGLKKKLAKTNELLDKLDEMLAQGEITEGKYKQLSKKYSDEVENLKNLIAEGVIKQDFGIKTEEEERAETERERQKARHEEESLKRQREEQERITRERELALHKEPEGTSWKGVLAVALVLGVLLIGYWVLTPGDSNAPENSKITPLPTPKLTPTVTQTPRITATVSPTSIAVSSADQKSITNSIGMEFVLIPAGEFNMGSPSNEVGIDNEESPVHRVKIANGFYIGKYEVTQKQWRKVMENNPSNFKGDNLPVEQVSWNDAQDFIKKLNEKEGANKYRLPSEAEWEYAARAGTKTSYSFGDDESKLGDYAWYDANSGSKTHDVGQKKPNPWGLYDMHGNVWEWVQDSYYSNYNGAPTDGSAWEGDVSDRVRRGGSWNFNTWGCRSAFRDDFAPAYRYFNLGFRLVRYV